MPLVGTFTVSPVVLRDVANGVPIVAVLADAGTEQLFGVTIIGDENVTATVVDEEMLHVPARPEGKELVFAEDVRSVTEYWNAVVP